MRAACASPERCSARSQDDEWFLGENEVLHVDGQPKADVIGIKTSCRLGYVSTTTVRLSRYGGKRLPMIDVSGNVYFVEIPAAGVDLRNTGLSADTTYYVYAYESAGVLTLEVSAAAPATDSSTGIRSKTGDSTKILVGMVRTNGSTQSADSTLFRFVLSWFKKKALEHRDGARRRPFYLVQLVGGASRLHGAGDFPALGRVPGMGHVQRDGGQPRRRQHPYRFRRQQRERALVDGGGGQERGHRAQQYCSQSTHYQSDALAEGYHYPTLLGQTNSGNTATWEGQNVDGKRCAYFGYIWG